MRYQAPRESWCVWIQLLRELLEMLRAWELLDARPRKRVLHAERSRQEVHVLSCAPGAGGLEQELLRQAQLHGARQRDVHTHEVIGPVGAESGSTDIRQRLLLFLKVFRAFGVFLKVFKALGTPKLVEGCHLTTARIQWLADCQI